MGDNKAYIDDALTGDALATIAALEGKVEAQRAENARLQSVVDEVADVKERALSCIRLVGGLNREKALLQSQLDDARGESDRKDDVIARLQSSQSDSRAGQLLHSQISALRRRITKLNDEKKVLVAQEKEIRDDALRKESALQSRIDQLGKDTEALKETEIAMQRKDEEMQQLKAQVEDCRANAQADAETSKSEIERLTGEISGERQLRDEALRGKSELEGKVKQLSQELNAAKTNADAAMQEKVEVMQQLSAWVEESKAASENEAETSRKLQSKLEQMTSELAKERKARDEASHVQSQLEGEIDQLNREMAASRESADEALQEKERMLRQAKDQAEQYKVLSGNESEVNQELTSQLEQAKSEAAGERKTRDELEEKVAQLTQELSVAKTNAGAAMQEKDRELQQLSVQLEECKATVDKEAESSRNLQSELERISSNLAKERESRENDKSGLQNKVAQLSQELGDAKRDADAAMREKDKELQHQSSQLEEYKAMVDREAESSRKLQSDLEQKSSDFATERESREKAESELRSKVAHLIEGMEVAKEEADAAMQEKILQLQRVNVLVEECRAKLDSENEKNRALQSEIEWVTCEVARQRQLNDEALEVKADLECKVVDLRQKVADAEASAEKAIQEKTQALQELSAQVDECKVAMKNESDANSRLQKDLESATSKFAEERNLMAELKAELVELKRKHADAEENAKTSMEEKDRELQRTSSQIDELRSEIDAEVKSCQGLQLELDRAMIEASEERQLKGEALLDKSQMECKIAELNRDLEAAKTSAEAELQGKEQELRRLSSQVDESRADIDSEVKSNQRLQLELLRVMSEASEERQRKDEALRDKSALESKIAELNRELDAAKLSAEIELQEKAEEQQKLQSELDKARAEMTESLAKANEKGEMFADLREKHDNMLMKQVANDNAFSEKTISAQKEELKRMNLKIAIKQTKFEMAEQDLQAHQKSTLNQLVSNPSITTRT